MSMPMKAKLTLLEQARQIPRSEQGNADPERLAVAIAYANHEITGSQAAAVFKVKGNIFTILAATIMNAVRTGRARIEVLE